MKKIFFETVPINIVKNADYRLLESPYVVFDIETTGLNPNKDKIIQFGAIKFVNNKPIDEIEFFIDPECEIPKEITAINHIENKDVKGQIKIKEGLLKIIQFFQDFYLVAHNGINFDINFINNKL
ncbi:MAG: ribonuclease H-like domain-containing protein, partial [Malacoplasma sp.]|nr:ribonuclease H-like domain-containing protein [Malacoplasma sp.]